MIRAFGDFQTPAGLVRAVLHALNIRGDRWPRVLEPTCGSGSFIAGLAALEQPPREIKGIEVQEDHFVRAGHIIPRLRTTILNLQRANLFDLDLRHDLQWQQSGPLLVIGNPPWVTSATLGALEHDNLPRKFNVKGLKGLDALTGSSNFDLAEYIWLKLIYELEAERPTIALLCKTVVARNVLLFAAKNKLAISGACIRRIDAKQWFGVAVDACLFQLEVGSAAPHYEAMVYGTLDATQPEKTIGVVNGQLVADIEAHRTSAFADGISSLEWRQGIKHDAAMVMELASHETGIPRNKLNEPVEIEPEYVYPLLKSSDLFHGVNHRPYRLVIVTQPKLGWNTHQLEVVAPDLWRYLTAHVTVFEQRKSSIYRGQSAFAMFGIGEYSFALYKVAVSGLYKAPRFRCIGPVDRRPVMVDDTCYFIACHSPMQAALLTSLLNSQECLALLRSMTFSDSKRPITKKLLQRIDLRALLQRSDLNELLTETRNELKRLGVDDTIPEAQRSVVLEELLRERVVAHPRQTLPDQLGFALDA